MAVTKQFVTFTLSSDNTYKCSISKTRTPYAVYVVEGGYIDSDTKNIRMKYDEIVEIKRIFAETMKNNPLNIQPTPLFFFQGSNDLVMNISNWYSSYSNNRGLGSVAFLQPVYISTKSNNLMSIKMNINGSDAYINGNPGYLYSMFRDWRLISYKPHKDIAADSASTVYTYRSSDGSNNFDLKINATADNVVKTIEMVKNPEYPNVSVASLLFANTADLQYDSATTRGFYLLDPQIPTIGFLDNSFDISPFLFDSIVLGPYGSIVEYPNFFKSKYDSSYFLPFDITTGGSGYRVFMPSTLHALSNQETSVRAGRSTPYSGKIGTYYLLPLQQWHDRDTNRNSTEMFAYRSFIFSNEIPTSDDLVVIYSKKQLLSLAYSGTRNSVDYFNKKIPAVKLTANTGPIFFGSGEVRYRVGDMYDVNIRSLGLSAKYIIILAESPCLKIKILYGGGFDETEMIDMNNGNSGVFKGIIKISPTAVSIISKASLASSGTTFVDLPTSTEWNALLPSENFLSYRDGDVINKETIKPVDSIAIYQYDPGSRADFGGLRTYLVVKMPIS